MYVNVHFDALFHFMEKGPYFHKLWPLLSPKVFVTLGKIKVTLYSLQTKPNGSFPQRIDEDIAENDPVRILNHIAEHLYLTRVKKLY